MYRIFCNNGVRNTFFLLNNVLWCVRPFFFFNTISLNACIFLYCWKFWVFCIFGEFSPKMELFQHAKINNIQFQNFLKIKIQLYNNHESDNLNTLTSLVIWGIVVENCHQFVYTFNMLKIPQISMTLKVSRSNIPFLTSWFT